MGWCYLTWHRVVKLLDNFSYFFASFFALCSVFFFRIKIGYRNYRVFNISLSRRTPTRIKCTRDSTISHLFFLTMFVLAATVVFGRTKIIAESTCQMCISFFMAQNWIFMKRVLFYLFISTSRFVHFIPLDVNKIETLRISSHIRICLFRLI